MRYAVGDRVLIRKDLKAGKKYGQLGCTIEMERLAGTVQTVVDAEHFDYSNWSHYELTGHEKPKINHAISHYQFHCLVGIKTAHSPD